MQRYGALLGTAHIVDTKLLTCPAKIQQTAYCTFAMRALFIILPRMMTIEEHPMSVTPSLAHPTLYGLTPDGALALFGQQCQRCSRISFPRQRYGCEQCGAFGDDLRELDLAAEGELQSFALVHRHHGHDIQTPFVMAEVRLTSGPLLRCTLAQRDDTGLTVGGRVVGVLVDGATPDAPRELRFTPVRG